ncbi:MAG: hypothetical protein MI919_02230, partial [Holophagales bacterium]|nr:hypothetical protein [Holophagales bacterium]
IDGELDGRPAGRLTLEGPDGGAARRQVFRLPVPAMPSTGGTELEGDARSVMEVHLLPRDWGVAEERQVLEAVSFRPILLRALGGPGGSRRSKASEQGVDEGGHQGHRLQEDEDGGER